VVIADEKYVVLTVADATTQARLVPLSDGRLGLCPADEIDADGQEVTLRPDRPDSPAVHGTAAVVRSGRAFDETRSKIRRKYGWRGGRLSSTDAVLLVRLE
jgi:hypothetical protein